MNLQEKNKERHERLDVEFKYQEMKVQFETKVQEKVC